MKSPCSTRAATEADAAAISRLHDKAFGPGRFTRTAYRIREGTGDVSRYCRIALAGPDAVGAIRMTDVTIGGNGGAVMLGPLAVDPDHIGQGIGTALVNEAIGEARSAGVKLVFLVGDAPYYGRFGFKPVPGQQIVLPGPVDLRRILAIELSPGALAGYRGLVAAVR